MRIETQLLKQGQVQVIEFVAVTAASLIQDFLFDRRKIDQHRLAGQGGQVLKREHAGVAQLKLTQGLQGRRRRRIEAQPLQV
ncbi:hypothetical protein D3C87_1758660 [compost metagenome]